MRTIYFDYNATTPLDPAARAAMLPFLDPEWGNPSSIHRIGRRARVFLDDARERVARVLGCKPSEIIFTSGGTESNNLAVIGAARRLKDKGRHLICSAIEHHAVLSACQYLAQSEGFELSILPVDSVGLVHPDTLKQTLRQDTILVSVMAANNEIGTIQPVADLGAICQAHGVMFHTDAVQWFGKKDFSSVGQFNANLVSLCAHKIHGPKGAGLFFSRSPFKPHPILYGGSHENEQRPGTENLAAIAGLAAAVERFVPRPVFSEEKMQTLTLPLRTLLDNLPGVKQVGQGLDGLTNTVSFVVEGTDAMAVLAALDLEGICASSGAACSAGSLEPSHVIKALGLKDSLAHSLIRFSLGRETTSEEVEIICQILPFILSRSTRRQ